MTEGMDIFERVHECIVFITLQVVGAIDGDSKEKLLAEGGFVPRGLPQDYWSSMSPPLEEGVAEVALGASHAHREPPDEVSSITLGVCTADKVEIVLLLDVSPWSRFLASERIPRSTATRLRKFHNCF